MEVHEIFKFANYTCKVIWGFLLQETTFEPEVKRLNVIYDPIQGEVWKTVINLQNSV